MMQLSKIMLIDDSEADNLYHRIVIEQAKVTETIIAFQYAEKALSYLRQNKKANIDLILLDINMPRMNGFEFIEAYNQLDEAHKVNVVIMMLTTSLNPDDEAKARAFNKIHGFMKKPLTEAMLKEIIANQFS